ncbi:DUF1015 family protein [Heyndrickxia oleronia]|uniref:DUF1015 family protein n=1 Tax=Heyndrickxia TaxID=2837504 RepID=UPI001B1D8673|nr:DUF1015 family protein [Heyndrickxia oleronia]MCM3454364.1 DUF1015 family protein [Heyndrickxia oleronia]GIN39722.1 hypothetical protein J19TS1_26710 [Heyndrickxia oleronia]
MRIDLIEKSFINISGKLYDSEFINLVNIKDNKISLDERTLFLTIQEKEILNAQSIRGFDDAVYVFKYKNVYGLIADLSIKEYDSGRIKCHELVLPDTVQGMLSNLHGYNCEAAPILLGHRKKIDYKSYIDRLQYKDRFSLSEDFVIYVFCGEEATKITEEFLDEEHMYVADGHHRLYTTSLSTFKNSVFSCLISLDYLDIQPIHRIIPNVDAQLFEKAKDFIYSRFEVLSGDTPLSKGKIRIGYDKEKFVVNLIDLNSDAFWNNDIYRLNTQIISQAFRIFDTGSLRYLSNGELIKYKEISSKKDVIIETFPIGKEEFVECANKNCIMPPKSTFFSPKFPSFLIFKQYK